MMNWVLLGKEAALEIEMTVFAKAWLCEITCYYRECQVPCEAAGGTGERLCDCVGGGAGRQPGGGAGHSSGASSGFYPGPVRLALQFRQRPLVDRGLGPGE